MLMIQSGPNILLKFMKISAQSAITFIVSVEYVIQLIEKSVPCTAKIAKQLNAHAKRIPIVSVSVDCLSFDLVPTH